MYDVQLQSVLLAVYSMLSRVMEVKLNSSGCEVTQRIAFVEKVDGLGGHEVFPVVKSDLVRSSGPCVLSYLLSVFSVVMHIVHILKTNFFKLRVICRIPK